MPIRKGPSQAVVTSSSGRSTIRSVGPLSRSLSADSPPAPVRLGPMRIPQGYKGPSPISGLPYIYSSMSPATATTLMNLNTPAPTTPAVSAFSDIPFPATPAVAYDVPGAPDVHWTTGNYTVPGTAPDWWRPFVPTDMSVIEGRPDVQMTLMLNALIPYLSQEDQVRAANQLYTMWDTELSQYKPDRVQYPNPAPITEEESRRWGSSAAGMPIISDYYGSGQRATDALQALSNMREATVGTERMELGPGYKWLQDITGAIQSQGGGRSPAQQLQLMGALDPLMSQASSGELSPFAAIGQMLATPFFSRGQMRDTSANRQLMW